MPDMSALLHFAQQQSAHTFESAHMLIWYTRMCRKGHIQMDTQTNGTGQKGHRQMVQERARTDGHAAHQQEIRGEQGCTDVT